MIPINPRVDIAFKKIFGVEENKDLLMSLINSIVSDQDQVADITLLNPYNPQNFKSQKLSVLDIKAKSHDGKRFNIEIQISDEADYDKRALYYWGKLYTEQLKAGEDYAELSKAIGIHILNFISIAETEEYHNTFHIVEKNRGFVYFKDLELHTIELKKFADANAEVNDIVAKIKTSLDRWSAFLIRHDLFKLNNLPQALEDINIKKALDVLDIMNFNGVEREAYEEHLKWLWIEANTVKKAEARGMEAGMEAGMAAGMAAGKELGSLKARLEIAKNLLAAGVSKDIVRKTSGLLIQQMQELEQEVTVD